MSTNPPPQGQHFLQPRGSATGSGTATPSHGSVTQTIHDLRPLSPDPLVLRLRGSHEPTSRTVSEEPEETTSTSRRRRIQWAEDVVDNEGLGRKKSKVCCIFHKTREVGESSSEEDSSSSDSDSDGSGGSSGADDGSARPVGGGRRRQGKNRGRKGRRHEHEHGDGCGHGDGSPGKKRPSPNAYERMPKYDIKPLAQQPGK